MAKLKGSARKAQRFLKAIGIILAFTGMLLLILEGPWFFDRAELGGLDKDSGPKAVMVSGLRTALAALVVAAAGAVGLYFTSQTLRVTQETLEHTRAKDRAQEEIAREGQVTERYVKAVELLGAEGREGLTKRLGAVYALERIMRDSEKDHSTVVQLLAAFVRNRAPHDPEMQDPTRVPDDVQAALTVLAQRPDRPEQFQIDLSHADLSGAVVVKGRLARASFAWSRLDGADFSFTDLFGADLRNSFANNAKFRVAFLADADLREANLQGASFAAAVLRGARLKSAELQGARFTAADLSGAELDHAKFIHPDGTGIAVIEVEQLLQAHLTSTTVLHARIAENPKLRNHIRAGDISEYGRDLTEGGPPAAAASG